MTVYGKNRNRTKDRISIFDLIIFFVLFIALPILGIKLLLQPGKWKKVIGAICLVAGISMWGYAIYDFVYLPKMEKKQEQKNIEDHTYTMGCGVSVRLPVEWDESDYTVDISDDVLTVYDNKSVKKGCMGRLLYVKNCTKDESDKLYNNSEAEFKFKYFDKDKNEYRYVYAVTSYYNTEQYTYKEREEEFHKLEDDLVWGLAVIPLDQENVEYSRD